MKKMLEYFLLEFKVLFRVPIALFFTLFFPQLMLLVFVLSSKNAVVYQDVHLVDVFLPMMMLLSLFSSGITSMAVIVAGNRANRVWTTYRLRGFSTSQLIGVTLWVNILLSFMSSVLLILFSKVFFNAKIPSVKNLVLFFLVWFVMAFATFMIGFTIGLVCKHEKIAQSIATPVMFILMVVSGMMVNETVFPDSLQKFFSYIPTNQANKILIAYWTGIENAKIQWSVILIWLMLSSLFVFFKLQKEDLRRG